jgi:hypothetical protein
LLHSEFSWRSFFDGLVFKQKTTSNFLKISRSPAKKTPPEKMAETGHAKNVEYLKKARDFAVSWGSKYAPTNPNLLIAAINNLIENADNMLDAVQTNKTPYRNATSACEEAFAPLGKLTTRIIKSLQASGVSALVIEDAKTYSRKILGQRKTAKKVVDPNNPAVNESPTTHSTSQMSRVQLIEHFDSLRSLSEAQDVYKPNEADLKTNSLQEYSENLKAKTQTVGTSFVEFSNSLKTRDDVLYDDEVNVVAIGKLFRIYVESAFGRGSNEWNQVKGLVFKSYSRK